MATTNRYWVNRLALVAGVAVLCGACSTTPDTSIGGSATSSPNADEAFARTKYTIVWSDPAGLDLLSSEGTYVRASVESLDVSAANGNADAAAPGFWESLVGTAKTEAENFFEMGPTRTEYGIKRYEVLGQVHDGDSVTVTVCSYNQQIGHDAVDTGAGQYEFGGTGPHSEVITLERAGDTPPPAHRSGPDTFPVTPLFGSWSTTGWEMGFFPDGGPCAGRRLPGVAPGLWPQTRGTGPYTMDELPRDPSYPGWPNRAVSA